MDPRPQHMKVKRTPTCPILFFLSTITLFSCSNSDVPDDMELLYWQETKCTDPWGTTENDSESVVHMVLGEYLKDHGVDTFVLKEFTYVLVEGEVTCDACSCPTGTVIAVEVDKTHVEKMEELGFRYEMAN